MKATCPGLARQIATFKRMYTHLSKRDLRRIRDTHWCQECPGAWVVPPHLSRDPEDE